MSHFNHKCLFTKLHSKTLHNRGNKKYEDQFKLKDNVPMSRPKKDLYPMPKHLRLFQWDQTTKKNVNVAPTCKNSLASVVTDSSISRYKNTKKLVKWLLFIVRKLRNQLRSINWSLIGNFHVCHGLLPSNRFSSKIPHFVPVYNCLQFKIPPSDDNSPRKNVRTISHWLQLPSMSKPWSPRWLWCCATNCVTGGWSAYNDLQTKAP